MKRCFIVGNGPSQNNVDLTLLKDETTFGMNDIRLKFDTFMPTYWVVLDQHYWGNYKKEICDWDNHSCKVIGIGSGRKHPLRYEYIAAHGDPRAIADGRIGFWGNREGSIFSLGNVGYACMQIACQKGFREINLIGFDSDRTRPRLEAHFDTNYGERLTDPNDRGRGFALPSDCWVKGYKVAIKEIEKMGGSIWDVSDSPLNIFPKRTMEEALA